VGLHGHAARRGIPQQPLAGKQGILDTMKDDILGKAFRGKRVLVTGDTGFKGSWLCVFLVHLGASVTGLSLPPKSKRENYSRAGLSKAIRHFDADINDFDAVQKVMATTKPCMVFHCAAQALVLESYRSPRETFRTNVLGTLNVLEAARLCSAVKAIVNVTSDKCYDNQEWIHGYRESDPLGGKDPYSASKAASEIVSAAYRHSYFCKKDAASLATARAGNVIGGGDWAANRIVPDCVRALTAGKLIVLRNPGAVRPWQHVLEPLRGYLMLMQKLYAEGNAWSGAWNFGPLQANVQAVEKLAQKAVLAWGNGTIKKEKSKSAAHEAGLLNLDISKALNYLGWRPALTFDETVYWTIEEYRNLRRKDKTLEVMQLEIRRYLEKAARNADAGDDFTGMSL